MVFITELKILPVWLALEMTLGHMEVSEEELTEAVDAQSDDLNRKGLNHHQQR